ncbi:MAG: hypothetical protein IJ597_07215, partial [Synergistaceae bacterium]|nr:hypothetical protein [Synergistaceae bacterium]
MVEKIKSNLSIAQEVLDHITASDVESEDNSKKNFRDSDFTNIAKETGQLVTDKELEKLDKALQELMTSEDTHVEIDFSASKLDKILKDGRFKSCFEVANGVGKSKPDYKKRRMAVETEMFKYGNSTSPEQRPIYASASSLKNISEYSKEANIYGSVYGNVTAILKPTVKSY